MTCVVAVTGVTGALAATSAADDVRPRLVVRDAALPPALPGAEVAENPGGYADGPGWRHAGRRPQVVLVPAGGERGRLQTDQPCPHASPARRGILEGGRSTPTEERLTASGMRWTALRTPSRGRRAALRHGGGGRGADRRRAGRGVRPTRPVPAADHRGGPGDPPALRAPRPGGRGLGDPASAAVPTLAGHPARPLATVLRSIPGCGVDRRRGPGQLPAAVITFQRSRL